MNSSTRTLITVAVVMAGAMIGSAILMAFTPKGGTWLAALGWGIFFVALQLPIIFGTRSAQQSCSGWFSRLGSKG